MAIRVKHEGNVTSRITAAAKGGRGKRAAEDGRAWMQIAAQEAMAGNKQLQGAHASPVSPGHATAQLAHAPTGAAPGIMHAPSGAIYGDRGLGHAGGSASGRSASVGTGDASGRLKVTGDRYFQRPDKESMWDWDQRRWVRPYLPGEYEAEVQQRVGDVKNTQQQEMLEFQQGLKQKDEDARMVREYSARQKAEMAKLNEIRNSLLDSGQYSQEDIERMMPQIQMRMNNIRDNPDQLLPGRTAQEDFEQRNYVDEQGRVWSRADGKLIFNPADADAKRQEFEMKRQDALMARADKFYQDLLKPYQITEEVEDMMGKKEFQKKMVQRSDEEIEEIMRKRFPQLYPAAPAPTGQPFTAFDALRATNPMIQPFVPQTPQQPAVPQPTNDERHKKYSQFADR